MKPDWDELGEEFENSKKTLIGDVDCTAKGNEQLCQDQGVKGYPTIKYYVPGGPREGETYEGERDLKALKKFAKALGPACGPKHLTKCTDEQKAQLEVFQATPAAELDGKIAEISAEIAAAEKAHNELLESLQAQFKESDERIKGLKAKHADDMKLMQAVSAENAEKAAKAAEEAAAPAEAEPAKAEL